MSNQTKPVKNGAVYLLSHNLATLVAGTLPKRVSLSEYNFVSRSPAESDVGETARVAQIEITSLVCKEEIFQFKGFLIQKPQMWEETTPITGTLENVICDGIYKLKYVFELKERIPYSKGPSDYTLVVRNCPQEYPQKDKIEIVLKIKDFYLAFFDYNWLLRVSNTIRSKILSRVTFDAPGTETTITMNILNKPAPETVNSCQVYRNLLDESRGIMHAYAEIGNCIQNEKNEFLNLDFKIDFFILGSKVAWTKIQVGLSDKKVPFFRKT